MIQDQFSVLSINAEVRARVCDMVSTGGRARTQRLAAVEPEDARALPRGGACVRVRAQRQS